MRKVIVVPVIIGVLGTVSVSFKEYMKRIDVNVSVEVIQKTALLGSARDTVGLKSERFVFETLLARENGGEGTGEGTWEEGGKVEPAGNPPL